MHPSVDIEELKEEIEEYGHKVASIFNIKHRETKNPLGMFYVDLSPAENNKEIYDLQFLQHMRVTFEPPHQKRVIAQCSRCQRYEHTQKYCTRQPRCVTCGKTHWTKECKKVKTSPPTCVLCNGNHPANYKGCSVYKEIHKSKPHKHHRTSQLRRLKILSPNLPKAWSPASPTARNSVNRPASLNNTKNPQEN